MIGMLLSTGMSTPGKIGALLSSWWTVSTWLRHVGGEPEHEEIDRDAGDDLVDAVGDDERAEQQAHQPADDDRGHEPDGRRRHRGRASRADDGAGEGASEQHPLDADIHHRDALAERARPARRARSARRGRTVACSMPVSENYLPAVAQTRNAVTARSRPMPKNRLDRFAAPRMNWRAPRKARHRGNDIGVGRRRDGKAGQRERRRPTAPGGRSRRPTIAGPNASATMIASAISTAADDQRLPPPDVVEIDCAGRRVAVIAIWSARYLLAARCGTPTGTRRASAAAPRRR